MWKTAAQFASSIGVMLMLFGCATQTANTTEHNETEEVLVWDQPGEITQQPLTNHETQYAEASLQNDAIVPDPTPLEFSDPIGWIPQQPQSSMRRAQYVIPAREKDDENAELVVYYFGESGAGDIGANVERWCNQFLLPDDTPPVEAAVITERTVNGRHMYKVDLTGRYVAPAQPGSDEYVDKSNYRLLASILLSDHGPYYIKMLGPVWTVTAWAPSFDDFVNQIR